MLPKGLIVNYSRSYRYYPKTKDVADSFHKPVTYCFTRRFWSDTFYIVCLHHRSVIYNFTNNMHTFTCGPYTECVSHIITLLCAGPRRKRFFFTLLPSIHLSHCYNIIILFVFVLHTHIMYIRGGKCFNEKKIITSP